ncbi:hypothetical protein AB0M39_05615 [Streptomyces sp. NPDC051907]|uniref:hypothetical protein n=1 Tax=Streptomyces sp. NPDC051907 TaxID=3155284 RepID=UPI00341793C8
MHAAKIIHDEREWLKYLRRESVVRVLNRENQLVSEKIGEAADEICEILERTDLPTESASGFTKRVGRWTREKVSRGIRFPRHDGPSHSTFMERLYEWVAHAMHTNEAQAALDRVGYPDPVQRAEIFAVAVANEVRGLLRESRRPEGQNNARYRMAGVVLGEIPDREVRERHAHWRAWLQALVAGTVAGLTSDLLFTDNWLDSLGVGAAVATGGVAREIVAGRLVLGPDMLAARRQVMAWLRRLPGRLSRRIEWSDISRAEAVMASSSPLHGILGSLTHGDAVIGAFQADEPDLVDLDDLIRLAGDVGDSELRALLIDVRTAMKYEPHTLAEVMDALIIHLDGESDPVVLPNQRPAILVRQPRVDGELT